MTAPLDHQEFEPELDPSARFRYLLSEADKTSPDAPLPASVLEDLPEETRQLLQKVFSVQDPENAGNLSDTFQQALRDQGYVLEEDTKGGVRFSGDLRRHTDSLSPYDVVRIAADLEGGVQQSTELRLCSECQAATPNGHQICQWCGAALS